MEEIEAVEGLLGLRKVTIDKKPVNKKSLIKIRDKESKFKQRNLKMFKNY